MIVSIDLESLDIAKAKLDALRPLRGPQVLTLGEAWDIEMVYESNRIEGNSLTLRETEMVVARGMTIAGKPLKDHLEAVNLMAAWRRLLDMAAAREAVTESEVMELHAMVMARISDEEAGRYRRGFVRIAGAKHVPPYAAKVPELMTALFSQTPLPHPVAEAARVHRGIASVHPFSDGNGRMARCLQTLILTRETALAEPFSSIEEFLGDPRNTPEYYSVLTDVDQGRWEPTGATGRWIRFILKAHYMQAATTLLREATIAKLWAEIETEVARRRLPERADAALVNAALGFRLRNSTYRNDVQVTEDVAGRDLKALVQAGMLQPIGENRGRTYVASASLKQLGDDVRASVARPILDPVAAA